MTSPDQSEVARSRRRSAWSRYWASGVRHSCPGSFRDHYGAATQQFWRRCFNELSDTETVLELGCGNGSLVRFLADVEPVHLPARIYAVDSAHLNSSWLSELPEPLARRVRLYGSTFAQQLPFGDDEVHWIYSQFALEYFFDADCWAEMQRILAPKAGFAAITHRKDSLPYRLAVAEQAQIGWLIGSNGILELAERILPHLVQMQASIPMAALFESATADRARTEFNGALWELERRSLLPGGDVLDDAARHIMGILRRARSTGAIPGLGALQHLREELRDGHLRVAELVRCALDDQDINNWTARLRAAGFSNIEVIDVLERGSLFGVAFCGRRP